MAEQLDRRFRRAEGGDAGFEEMAAFANLLFTHPAGKQIVGVAFDLDDLLGNFGGRAHGLRAEHGEHAFDVLVGQYDFEVLR